MEKKVPPDAGNDNASASDWATGVQHRDRTRDRQRAREHGDRTGELVVEVGTRTVRLDDGEELSLREVARHPALDALTRARAAFFAVARSSGNMDCVAVAHVLAALEDAVLRKDGTALEQPHVWARSRLRPSEDNDGVAFADWIPVADSKNRTVEGLSPAFDALVKAVGRFIAEATFNRASLADAPHDRFSEEIAIALDMNFRGLYPPERGVRRADIRARVSKRLRENQFSSAEDLAEQIVRSELQIAGWDAKAIKRALAFLDTRAARDSRKT